MSKKCGVKSYEKNHKMNVTKPEETHENVARSSRYS